MLVKDHLASGKDLMAPENKNLLKALLHKYGMDITKSYEQEVYEHRNVFNEVVVCPMFMGISRQDPWWNLISDTANHPVVIEYLVSKGKWNA